MSFIQIASFLLITTVSVQVMKAQGEMFLSSGSDKDQVIKTTDKRIDNFRVPVETPFDPNFWPARGRRGRDDNESQTQSSNCILADQNVPYDKDGLRCTDRAYVPKNEGQKLKGLGFEKIEFNPKIGIQSEFLDNRRRLMDSCYSLIGRLLQTQGLRECKDYLGTNIFSNTLDSTRHKKYYDFPGLLWFYDGDVFWRPDSNRNGEKEKKQDVFWVARGKKNFF